jgi:hypothetical protein
VFGSSTSPAPPVQVGVTPLSFPVAKSRIKVGKGRASNRMSIPPSGRQIIRYVISSTRATAPSPGLGSFDCRTRTAVKPASSPRTYPSYTAPAAVTTRSCGSQGLLTSGAKTDPSIANRSKRAIEPPTAAPGRDRVSKRNVTPANDNSPRKSDTDVQGARSTPAVISRLANDHLTQPGISSCPPPVPVDPSRERGRSRRNVISASARPPRSVRVRNSVNKAPMAASAIPEIPCCRMTSKVTSRFPRVITRIRRDRYTKKMAVRQLATSQGRFALA